MEIHIISISSKAISMFLSPKNIMDQLAFSTSCKINTSNPLFRKSFFGESHILETEIPISVYSTVHTGENIQFGGLKLGFTRFAYHPGIADVVNIAPINPAT